MSRPTVSGLFEQFEQLTASKPTNHTTAASSSVSVSAPSSSLSYPYYSSLSTSPVALVHALNVRRSSIQSTRRSTAPLQILQQEIEREKRQQTILANESVVEKVESQVKLIKKRMNKIKEESSESGQSSENENEGLHTPMEYHSPEQKPKQNHENQSNLINQVTLSSSSSSAPLSSPYYPAFYPFYPLFSSQYSHSHAHFHPHVHMSTSNEVSLNSQQNDHENQQTRESNQTTSAVIQMTVKDQTPSHINSNPPIHHHSTVPGAVSDSPLFSPSPSVLSITVPSDSSSILSFPSDSHTKSSNSLFSALEDELQVTKLDNEILMKTLKEVQTERELLLKQLKRKQIQDKERINQTRKTYNQKSQKSEIAQPKSRKTSSKNVPHPSPSSNTSKLTRIVARIQSQRDNQVQTNHLSASNHDHSTPEFSSTLPLSDLKSSIPTVTVRLDELQLL
jgi:hypothetical protein